jgi:hypothetical protein
MGTVTIAAPISGSVIDLAIAPGAYWNDPTAALMTVTDLSTIAIDRLVRAGMMRIGTLRTSSKTRTR